MSPISSRNIVPPSASSKRPSLLRDGAGEGALLVAEQLALEQPGRDGRAVHLHEGAFAPVAQVVDGARDQLLAGAVSPRISTVESVGATVSTCRSIRVKAGLSPTISSKLYSVRISSSR